MGKLAVGKKSRPKLLGNWKRNFLVNMLWLLDRGKSWLKRPEKLVLNVTNKRGQLVGVLSTFTKLFWKIVFTQLKLLVRGFDTSWMILLLLRLFLIGALKLPSSTKSLLSVLFIKD